MKKYNVSIELDTLDITVSANNMQEAKQKALAILKKKNINSLIRRSYPDNKRNITVDEL